ncbi:MAG: hypothetical protein NT163_10980 [Chlorobiales bacterium]|nr:hypothetical protein [Chlorobiales bacterium]
MRAKNKASRTHATYGTDKWRGWRALSFSWLKSPSIFPSVFSYDRYSTTSLSPPYCNLQPARAKEILEEVGHAHGVA